MSALNISYCENPVNNSSGVEPYMVGKMILKCFLHHVCISRIYTYTHKDSTKTLVFFKAPWILLYSPCP